MTLGGAYDDVIRHSLSRLSSFHLVTNNLSRNRLIKWDEKKIEYSKLIPARNRNNKKKICK